jgi:hypothetical protein
MYGIVRLTEIGHPEWGLSGSLAFISSRAFFFMPFRRIDDRIRRLSDQVIDASRDELDEILPNLLEAIHEKMERLRDLAMNRFLGGRQSSERRIFPD